MARWIETRLHSNHSTDIGLASGSRLGDVQKMATDFMREISITNLILSLLGSAGDRSPPSYPTSLLLISPRLILASEHTTS